MKEDSTLAYSTLSQRAKELKGPTRSDRRPIWFNSSQTVSCNPSVSHKPIFGGFASWCHLWQHKAFWGVTQSTNTTYIKKTRWPGIVAYQGLTSSTLELELTTSSDITLELMASSSKNLWPTAQNSFPSSSTQVRYSLPFLYVIKSPLVMNNQSNHHLKPHKLPNATSSQLPSWQMGGAQ